MSRIDKIISLPNKRGIDVYETVKEHHFGLYETIGKRPSQEDAAFACWYTRGHFDWLSPQEIGRRLWTSYHLVNSLGYRDISGGTTASTTVYDGRGNLITATLADSVCFAVVYNQSGELAGVIRLNKVIHHPDEELERIQRAGGKVSFGRVNGQLAVSRALGDFAFNPEVVCADAQIDINRLDELYASLGLPSEQVGTVQIITTCDGFTEPLQQQGKNDHEQWLLSCLREIASPTTLEEHQLAKMLATKALDSFSYDNISIAVQTLSQYMPFMMGIYDGHAGKKASIYTANNIGDLFDQQCALTPEAYAQQPLSAENNCVTYHRDNQDPEWYEPLAEALRKHRETKFSTPNGIWAQMDLLTDQVKKYAANLNPEDENSELLDAVSRFYIIMNELCRSYADLTLSEKEFVECLSYILESNMMFEFNAQKYSFMHLNFTKAKDDVAQIKSEYSFLPIMMNLRKAVISMFPYSLTTYASTQRFSVFSQKKNDNGQLIEQENDEQTLKILNFL